MNNWKRLFTHGIWPFIKALYGLLKACFQWLLLLNRRWNEGWLLVLGFVAWKYSGNVLFWLDPTAPPLPANDLMRFLYATIGTCIGHFVVTVMLKLSHPLVFRYFTALFYQDLYANDAHRSTKTSDQLQCIRLKYSLLVLLLYLGTWLVLAATY